MEARIEFPRDELVRLWKNGEPLSYAWWHFATEELREQVRDAPTAAATEVRQVLLIADLYVRLSVGELLAIGDPVFPTGLLGPSPLPAEGFDRPPTLADGQTDTVKIWGITYDKVRVTELPHRDPNEMPQMTSPNEIDLPSRSLRNEGNVSSVLSADNQAMSAEGGGQYPQAEPILHRMFGEDSAYWRMSAEKMIGEFNRRWSEEGQRLGVLRAPLSARTLRSYLRWFRQKMARVGKFQVAN